MREFSRATKEVEVIYYRLIFIILVISLSLSIPLFSQSSFGGYSNEIKWKQINTPIVRVIFPDSLEERAQRVANIIHYMNDENVGLLGEKRRKVDIILRNRDVISNGYAQIAPLKSEFFMQAPQKTFEESAVDWTDQLALHEYRHVSQFFNAKRGIGNLVYWLFGDYGWGAMIGLSMPAWFIEGDATIIETAHSAAGRGRIPSFSSRQRAQLEADVHYSYMKAMNGSFKDFVPNHYNTGYLIISEMRRTADNEDFDEITRRSSNLKGVFYPFRRAVRKVTGTKIKQHYFNASDNLKSTIPSPSFSSEVLTALEKKNVVLYNNPILDGDDLYFSMADRREIRGIYKYAESGDHELITYQGLVQEGYFDKHENYFVWEEVQRDIRRGNQNFANLILYDSETKQKRIIGRNQAFRTPSFSRDGKSLIFVNGYLGTESGISIYNIETNALLNIIKSSDRQYLYPVHSADGRSVYSVVKKQHDYALAKIGLDGSFELLTDWDDIVFGPIKLSDGHLIFQANVGATDQVHAFELKSSTWRVISDDAVGMYNPSNYSNGYIVAERPHSQGFLLHRIKTSPREWRTTSVKRIVEKPFYLETDHLEPDNILDKVPNNTFEISKYRRNGKIFRPHSWLLSSDGTEVEATIFSDNILNQVNIQPTYTYNTNIRGSFVGLDVNYGRYFPIYQLSYRAGLPRIATIQDGERSFEISQHSIAPGILIPLNLTSGIYGRNLRLSTSIIQSYNFIEEIGEDQRFDQQGTTFSNFLSFNALRLRGVQNIYPKWGYAVTLRNRFRFNDSHNTFNITNDIFVPGFRQNHGFRFEIDYAVQNEPDENRIYHIDAFNYAAGFRSVDFKSVWGFDTNYAFPISYPDWGFADFLYFKRLKSTVFHNYNSVLFEDERTNFQALGADLLSDVVFNNNIFAEVEIGIRTAYMMGPLPEGRTSPWFFDFIFNVPAF